MPTLTQAAQATKKLSFYAVIAIFSFTIIWILYRIGLNYYHKFNPPKPPPAAVAFGKLPLIPIETPLATSSASFSYLVETVTGNLPKLQLQAKVYPTFQPNIQFLSLERARQKAQNLGFTGEPQTLSETLYFWTAPPNTPPRTLKMDIVSEEFEYRTNFRENPLSSIVQLRSVESAIQVAGEFINGLVTPNPDIKQQQISYTYYKFTAGDLAQTLNTQEANFVLVNFYREPLDSFAGRKEELRPIITDDPGKANIWAIVGPLGKGPIVVEASYKYIKIKRDAGETYPLKTASGAFDQLKKGKAVVLKAPLPGQKIPIRTVYLAYLEPKTYVPYLQPVFVFEGDGPFMAVVPAVAGEWIQTPPKK